MPYFDSPEERKAGPPRHTEKQLELVQCPHEARVPRWQWPPQKPVRPGMEPTLFVRCTRCGVNVPVTKTPPPGMRVILTGDTSPPPGTVVDDGAVIDETEIAPVPTGVLDETEMPRTPRRSKP